ncbi:glycosyltransferase family 2 protein [Rhodopirellula sp. ICT_H3.1]|uniref:Glycosyltransferase family 2 protein n=1 Tax=Aporhodopirellula aestuarii TaxID=2950107 RepID=A0ABT0U2A8_9BACT|nr:glycosyltransferase family 2 protein [Aporhodopirellula aestuarii]
MPKFPTIPRLTIVVPHGGDTASFESSLVSVLQHCPDACEVIVPHAGDYDDPFDLCDEVKFVDAGSVSLTQQIGQAAAIARGRFVHVVADGHVVTPDWADRALLQFEHHEAGLVVPVVRHSDCDEIAHAGWRRSGATACEMVAAGSDHVEQRAALRAEGGFLTASFWRRDLLRSLTGSLRNSDDVVEASMVYSLLARKAGWRCIVSPDCTIRLGDSDSPLGDYQSQVNENHRRLQAIADHFGTGGWGKSFGRFLATTFSYGLGSALRRATAPLAQSGIATSVRGDSVQRCDEQVEAIRIPVASPGTYRRAA